MLRSLRDVVDRTVQEIGQGFDLVRSQMRSTAFDIADLFTGNADTAADLRLRQITSMAQPGNELPELAVVRHTMARHDDTEFL